MAVNAEILLLQSLSTLAQVGKALEKKYGDEGLALMRGVIKGGMLEFLPELARAEGFPVGNGTIDDWLKWECYLAELSGNKCEVVENTPTRGVFRVLTCPFVDGVKSAWPEFCRKVEIAAEEAIAETIISNAKVHLDCYLTEGADSCDIVCEFKE